MLQYLGMDLFDMTTPVRPDQPTRCTGDVWAPVESVGSCVCLGLQSGVQLHAGTVQLWLLPDGHSRPGLVSVLPK